MNNGYLTLADLDAIDACIAAGDYRRVAVITSGSHVGDLWAAAMTAHYGPPNLHTSRRSPDDTPSPVCLAEFPHVREVMAKARQRTAELARCARRHLGVAT